MEPLAVDKALYTFHSLLDMQAQRIPDAPALLALGREPLSYRQFNANVTATVAQLNQFGIGRGKRVALCVPDGPEMVVLMVAALSTATIFPLNPALKAEDFDYILATAQAAAVIVLSGMESPLIAAAGKQGIPVITLTPLMDNPAGLFTLHGPDGLSPVTPAWAEPEDDAVIVATSGTTQRPKLVPRTNAAVFIGMLDMVPDYGLTGTDRLMHLVPSFVANGTIDIAWAMWVGAALACTPPFDAVNTFSWMDQLRPTVGIGTPYHWRAILAHASFNADILSRSQLRYIHAWAMVLNEDMKQELEAAFHAFVMNGYGATEIGGIAGCPIDMPRKFGECGLVFNSIEIEVRDADGRSLPTGEVGEVIVRGPSLFKGYIGDPDATRSALPDGWYHTGDLGHLDEDRHLFITGRIKEQISRGGAKVTPSEIEAVLLAHPAVAEAAAFGIPDRSLGEEIGAAVVLHPQQSVTEKDLRAFAAQTLPDYKAPRVLVIANQLPRTSLGKLQRIGMADRLGISLTAPSRPEPAAAAPRSPTEQDLIDIWTEVLKRPTGSIGLHDSFRDSGGDSLGATRLIVAIRERMNVQASILDLFDAPTIAEQAQVIDRLRQGGVLTTPTTATLIPIRSSGKRPPIFCLHAVDGSVYYYKDLVPHLDPEQPAYGLQSIGMDGTVPPLKSMEEIVNYCIKQIKSVQPNGPYYLLGFSFGGNVALEIGRKLLESNETAYVCILDSHFQVNYFDSVVRRAPANPIVRFGRRANSLLFGVIGLPMPYKVSYFKQKMQRATSALKRVIPLPTQPEVPKTTWKSFYAQELPPAREAVRDMNNTIGTRWIPRPYDGPLTYIRAKDDEISIPFFRVWKQLTKGRAELIDVPGQHFNLMRDPQVKGVAAKIEQWLTASQVKGQ